MRQTQRRIVLFRDCCPRNAAHSLAAATAAAAAAALVLLLLSNAPALLGEMHRELLLPGSTVEIAGSTAYVAQTAFIVNATIRENILFGRPFDKRWYDTVIDRCCLRPDLAELGAGDQTEVGEQGITLSGGQRQRLSLARAVYADADVYLVSFVVTIYPVPSPEGTYHIVPVIRTADGTQ